LTTRAILSGAFENRLIVLLIYKNIYLLQKVVFIFKYSDAVAVMTSIFLHTLLWVRVLKT